MYYVTPIPLFNVVLGDTLTLAVVFFRKKMKKTLVIGASTKPSRYAYRAIHRLVDKGHPVVAIGLREGTVAGVMITSEKKAFENVDTVTLYIGPRHQPEYYDYIVSLKPKRVIFNPGTLNPEFSKILNEANIEVIIDCTLVLLGANEY